MKRFNLKAIFICLLCGILGVLLGLYGKPILLTQLYGREMSIAVRHFRETELALETILEPTLILSVATEDYYPAYLKLNQVGRCAGCDRFWVITSAEVRKINVLEYSPTYAQVWASVVTWGHMVDAHSYERTASYEAPLEDISIYTFVRDPNSSQWLLQKISGEFSNPNQ